MKTIIAGSRSVVQYQIVVEAIALADWSITEVVSGHAVGVDQLGERWAEQHGVPVRVFTPIWRPGGVYNRRAGFERNEKMGEYAEALIAIWDQASNGTRHMIRFATARGLRVLVVSPQGNILSTVNQEKQS